MYQQRYSLTTEWWWEKCFFIISFGFSYSIVVPRVSAGMSRKKKEKKSKKFLSFQWVAGSHVSWTTKASSKCLNVQRYFRYSHLFVPMCASNRALFNDVIPEKKNKNQLAYHSFSQLRFMKIWSTDIFSPHLCLVRRYCLWCVGTCVFGLCVGRYVCLVCRYICLMCRYLCLVCRYLCLVCRLSERCSTGCSEDTRGVAWLPLAWSHLGLVHRMERNTYWLGEERHLHAMISHEWLHSTFHIHYKMLTLWNICIDLSGRIELSMYVKKHWV